MSLKFSIYKADITSSQPLPFFSSAVRAGFPSPADDAIEKKLDLNELMIEHPAATFFVRVEGSSMEGAAIADGDILVVERSLAPTHGKIVIAVLNGELTVKRLKMEGESVFLIAENPKFPEIAITPETDFRVWGVVTYVVHKC